MPAFISSKALIGNQQGDKEIEQRGLASAPAAPSPPLSAAMRGTGAVKETEPPLLRLVEEAKQRGLASTPAAPSPPR